jgi:coproporphyrinogen III oxidase
MKTESKSIFLELQSLVTEGVRSIDRKAVFREDSWQRSGGGGGVTRVFSDGEIFERCAVNFSEVWGESSDEMKQAFKLNDTDREFYAAGTSIIIHPRSPMIPTVHINVRYFKLQDKEWFGGGVDLTPYYLFEEDAVLFHTSLKEMCDKVDLSFYPQFKEWCDRYFFLPHRSEARGIGGLFFDYLGKDEESAARYLPLVKGLANLFWPLYSRIIDKRINEPWGEKEREFQLLRRGRYVEFNLLHDRGTQFGLKTNGRTESIFVSLPPLASWTYDQQILPGSREAELLAVLKNPRNWLGI